MLSLPQKLTLLRVNKKQKFKVLFMALILCAFSPFVIIETNLLHGVIELPSFFDNNFFFYLFLFVWVFYLPIGFLEEKFYDFYFRYTQGESLYRTPLGIILYLIIVLFYSYFLGFLIVFSLEKLNVLKKR